MFVAAAACAALAPQAMAAPMPWETGNTPTATVLCGSPCYQ
ncbi:hypothetical protein AB0D38_25500 [Streptomyces sp. NPDC048279]